MSSFDQAENKLDMSLDQIAEERKVSSGKAKNTKRQERLSNSGPYPPRNPRFGRQQNDDDDIDMTESSETTGRRVYVGNLSWNVKWQDLKDHMRSAGDVEHATILESAGRSKGCGIVTFSTEEEAQHAIETLNDTELDGRKIFVREDREVASGGPAATSDRNSSGTRGHTATRVYIGNLSWNVKWQDLKDHMKQAGNVVHADVLEEAGGRSKGCGLVEYSTPDEAQHAIETLNDTELSGRKIFVREDREPDGGSISSIAKRGFAGGRGNGGRGNASGRGGGRGSYSGGRGGNSSSGGEGRQLYVGNLPWDMTWQSLKDVFRRFGEVERTEIASYPDGRSRGFGIVRFADSSAARQAIDDFNGAEVNGREIEVRLDKRE